VKVRLLRTFLFALSMAACSAPHDTAGVGDASGHPVTTIPYDGGAVTWDGWAGEFFTQYCVQCHQPNAPLCVQCHAPGDPRTPDYRYPAPILANEATIRCGLAVVQDAGWGCDASVPPRTFPKVSDQVPNPLPSDDDRARIVEWFENGAP
jgi:hypothetical protein